MEGARLEVVARAAPGRVRPERRRDGRAAGLDQPRDADLAAQGRGLGRRAVADHARAQRPRPATAPAHAGLRRDRRRGRRQHRPRGRRAAARARRRAAGPLHHPPAAGRLAGRDPLQDREAGRRRRDAGDGRAGRRATSWSPRSSACSAPRAATRPPAATPSSCSRPREPGCSADPPRAAFPHNRRMALRSRARAAAARARDPAAALRGAARSPAGRGSVARPRTWSSGCGPATSRSSTTPTSTGSPPRTSPRAASRRSSTSPGRRPVATRTRAR